MAESTNTSSAPLERIPVRKRDGILLVPVSQISSIVAEGELLHIRTLDGKKYTINHRLRDLEARIDRTRFVWLSSLSQNNATISMVGTGTSVDTLSDFVANLKSTGYFRNINLARFDDSRGNYTFNLTCEFAPPVLQRTPEKGAN